MKVDIIGGGQSCSIGLVKFSANCWDRYGFGVRGTSNVFSRWEAAGP